jgi:hypothetical protein
MKITSSMLKQIIKEELQEVSSQDSGTEFDKHEQAFLVAQSLDAQMKEITGRNPDMTWDKLSMDAKTTLVSNALNNYSMTKYKPPAPVQEKKKR